MINLSHLSNKIFKQTFVLKEMTKTIDNNLEESRWLKKINKTAKPFGERYLGIGFQEEGRKAKLKQLSADIVEKAKEVNTNKEYEALKEVYLKCFYDLIHIYWTPACDFPYRKKK
ncbi:MAG: hypothetical protein QT05_C0002G0011 [archaeon GW2011_AR13]|nr:MAG: hypothetical protein QT05_C0002G0011 [archaeon GW2011_AR13]